MKKAWKKKLITIWIACFAILLSALAPSISSALAAQNGQRNGFDEICSTANISVGSIDKALNKSSDQSAHATTHCPFCLPHAGNFALPPANIVCCAVAAGHDIFPPLYYQAPTLLFTWVSANPRGPPRLS